MVTVSYFQQSSLDLKRNVLWSASQFRVKGNRQQEQKDKFKEHVRGEKDIMSLPGNNNVAFINETLLT